MENALKYQVALTFIPRIGPVTAKKLVEYLGSAEAVFREKPSALRRINSLGEYLAGEVARSAYLQRAEEEIRNMEKHHISAVYYKDAAYPWLLKNCDDGPLVLYYRGKASPGSQKLLSIVGTRNATRYGREMTETIIADLSARHPGLVIVSGLAYGIDVMAHRFALKYGLETFAVLAHGLTTLYPSSHADVAGKIVDHGLLLSDFHTSVRAERNNFLRRNRIIAGLSEGTLVVESGIKGGALVTGQMARSYDREVMTVPGRATDPGSSGCHLLVKEHIAALVEDASDIETALGWQSGPDTPTQASLFSENLSGEEEQVVRALCREPGIGLEILKARTALPLGRLMSLLLQMEVKKYITSMPGNTYRSNVDLNRS